ncbi:MAG: hypothetical protein HeimC2_07360 [Candidatus Heimdallarchaeota archaeon LC_2]|nr:MAG: hypothetical protein HeimC2_07360 [Candidatus Heimdallarchaeota archaeon LC_2]
MADNETSIKTDKNLGLLSRISNWIKLNPNSALYILVLIIGFYIRLFLALRAIGVYHPDEIFQSLEMAHLIVFDSGYTPPEFLKENPNIESYAASRSWIFPLIFAAIMRFGEIIGLDYHNQTLPLIRIFLAINSTLLIPATRKFVSQLTHNDTAGVLSAIFVAFWWRLAELTVRPLSNTFFLPMLFYGLFRMLVVMETKKISKYDHFIIAIFVGLSTYIRLDLGIVVFAVFIATFHIRQYKQYFEILSDGITGWTIGILVDYSYYDRIFTVPVNWLTFALDHGDDFGVSDKYYYWNELVIADGLSNFASISFVILFYTLARILIKSKINSVDSVKSIEFGYVRLFVITVISWLISSSVWDNETHKEIRFNTSGLVLLLLTIAVALTLFIEFVDESFDADIKLIVIKYSNLGFLKNTQWRKLVLVIGITLLLANQSVAYQDRRGYVESFDDVNLALAYVGQQSNVTGVILVGLWFLAGSYTYLHLGPEVIIEYTNLRDPGSFSYNQQRLRTLISDWTEGNYLILPLYQLINTTADQLISNEQFVLDLLNNNDFTMQKSIDGRTEVWARN